MADERRGRRRPRDDSDVKGFFIGVVAKMTGTHPQTLRHYERVGLVNPLRSDGSVRMYSMRDVQRVRRIRELTQDEGANLSGVEIILELHDRVEELRRRHRIELDEQALAHRREVNQLHNEIARLKRILRRATQ
jgi:MerR family transcriptional regulator/heat shock protein HspR